MIITRTITKKVLEKIVHETFSTFGNVSSSSLLDSLKLLGFYYATNAGVSINIEDLKTPNVKKDFLLTAEREMSFVSRQWEQGFVSDTERFQSIIDSWNIATDSLKNRIIDYYQNFDPANNLYIMAFSGARGNMSQVRQLVGMRGLMSDQGGKIIDLPIQTNFREGLSSIDYIISSYGARKGIVDTALKTADSGYLTRRLIFIAQDVIIREIDCHTKKGIIFFLNKNTTVDNIIGRVLLGTDKKLGMQKTLKSSNIILDIKTLKELKNNAPITLNIRSPLTCHSTGSVCQKCYGWDLAQQKLISLGEAVGIIAAQSIGEPGTQLTMRTFHTGGIFTSELLQQTVAPFSGKVILPTDIQKVSYRTNHGVMVLKLQRETTLKIVNWKGKISEINLEIGSFLYVNTSTFVKKGQLLAEYSQRSIIPGARRLKPIYTPISGEIRFENLVVLSKERGDEKPIIKVNQDDGILWVSSGKIFSLPKEARFLFPQKLEKSTAFACLKIVTPESGFVEIKKNMISIFHNKKIQFDSESILTKIKNCETKLSLFVKNYQFVDEHTLLGKIYFFPKYEGKIYAIRQKEATEHTTFFLITESDIWKINSDHPNQFSHSKELQKIARAQTALAPNTIFSKSGYLISKDGFKLIFQKAYPIFLSPGAILKYKQGDFVFENQILATLVNYTQQTEDIVQGLPKVEELIEARSPKLKTIVSSVPGIVLSGKLKNSNCYWVNENTTKLEQYKFTYSDMSFVKPKAVTISGKLIQEKSSSSVISRDNNLYKTDYNKIKYSRTLNSIVSPLILDGLVIYNGMLWNYWPIEHKLIAYIKKSKSEFYFQTKFEKLATFNGSKAARKWVKLEQANDSAIYLTKKGKDLKLIAEIAVDEPIYQNLITHDLILVTKEKKQIYLQAKNSSHLHKFTVGTKISVKPGTFIDVGEPLSNGMLDPQQLLAIFFEYHSKRSGLVKGGNISISQFQLILVNSIQGIYQSQGVAISSKHIEIIVRQMTAKGKVVDSGDTPLVLGEVLPLAILQELHATIERSQYRPPIYTPIFQSTTNASLDKEGFLAAAGFQETRRMLARAAIEGKSDWLRGLKESVIIGRLIPAGSAFLTYKNYLDKLYYFTEDSKRIV